MTESWLFASIVLVGAGFAGESLPLISIGALVFSTGGAARLWSRLSLERVTYKRQLSEHRAFVGESLDVTLTIANEKTLPVPWIELREALPRGMPASARTTLGASSSQLLTRSTSLAGNDRIEWPVTLRAVHRGYFRVGPGRIRSGDLFGFFEREMTVGQPGDVVIVYPATYPLADLGLDSARPFGDLRGGNRVFEDPSRVIGIRDYQPGDAMRRIDWYATARVGRLQSRLYEPSRSQSLVIALNIPTFEYSWQGSDPVLLERGVAVAASVARWASEQGYAVGLVANGSFPDADRTIYIGAGRRPDQANRLLEALATVTAFTTSPMSAALEDSAHPIPGGSTVVVVAAVMADDLVATLNRLRSEGHRVHVLKTSNRTWQAALDRIPVTDVSGAMEIMEREAIEAGVLEIPEVVIT
ncbi:MAG: DUF58 domain-containing protein [Chloroflexi bacterium]|nr:DUF58 domain-containing protein [Chloroflexota bacterium]